ncbi:MAG: nitronate monooxygenase [Deltaproteobacteria bacterium]|nr:MAG: nitronate monooxygenase [Deltaproteobacteria bacterium]
MIKTELCDMLGIKYPIIQAGMGPFSTNDLCVAAANAGCLGNISTFGMGIGQLAWPSLIESLFGKGTTEELVRQSIQRIKELTRESQGIFGINCLVAQEIFDYAEKIIGATLKEIKSDPEVAERLRVIITSAGNPAPWTERIKESGVKWFHVVPSVYHAQKAEKAGVDLVIASGHEGGGHIAWNPVHTMVLLPEIVKSVKVPVIGAGGFCDGASLAAALSLGAVGVQMGTRFIATKESDFVQMWKDQVIKAGDRDSLVVRGLAGPARALKTKFALEVADATIKKIPRIYLGEDVGIDNEIAAMESEGLSRIYDAPDKPEDSLLFGGEVSGRISSIPTVKELIEEVMSEAGEIIRNLPEKFLV